MCTGDMCTLLDNDINISLQKKEVCCYVINLSFHRLLLQGYHALLTCPPVLQLMVSIWFQNPEFEPFCISWTQVKTCCCLDLIFHLQWARFVWSTRYNFFSEAAIFIMCLKECSTLQYHKRHLSIQHCAILTRQIQKFYHKEAWTIFLLKPLTCAFHQYSKLSARVSIQFYMWWHHMVEIHGTCVVLMKKDYGLGSCELKVKKMHWDDRMLNVLHVKKIT